MIITYSNCKPISNPQEGIDDGDGLSELLLKEHDLRKGTGILRVGKAGTLERYNNPQTGTEVIHTSYNQFTSGEGQEYVSNLFVVVGKELKEMNEILRSLGIFFKEKGYEFVNQDNFPQ